MNGLFGWCLVFLAALPFTNALAQAELSPDRPLPNKDARRALAQGYAKAFIEVDRQIPQLSPTQVAWLKAEYHEEIAAAGNRFTKRALAAMNSLEYQIHVVKPKTGEIVAALLQITTIGPQSKSTEVALWASVASMLIDNQYWQAVGSLVDRKIIQPRIGHVDSYYSQNYALQAQNILSRIVVPHIDGRLP